MKPTLTYPCPTDKKKEKFKLFCSHFLSWIWRQEPSVWWTARRYTWYLNISYGFILRSSEMSVGGNRVPLGQLQMILPEKAWNITQKQKPKKTKTKKTKTKKKRERERERESSKKRERGRNLTWQKHRVIHVRKAASRYIRIASQPSWLVWNLLWCY